MLPSMAIVTRCEKAADADQWPNDWRVAMSRAIRNPAQLCQRLELPPEWVDSSVDTSPSFSLFAPLEFVSRMKKGDCHDPLLLQVLPKLEENQLVPGFTADPVGDQQATLAPGLIQKYRGRALLVTSGACAVHCRYCFRREFPYQQSPPQWSTWETALEQLWAAPDVEELILSGGDPLTLSDDTLSELVLRLAEIPHLKRLRLHTRLPIVIPQRVTDDMLTWLTRTRLTPIVVIHANHGNELDEFVAVAVTRLRRAGVTLLNQSVLMQGINDDVESLTALSESLINIGVIPYYLHLLDRATGTHAFEVGAATGIQLLGELRNRLPGYAVPRLAVETAGGASKEILF
ncbi:MAG: EF-P beta-lysylation protein EpmB [Pirellulaceae bacterium]